MQALDLCTQTHVICKHTLCTFSRITVTLSRNGDEITFRGFFVQARLAADGTTRVGTFAVRDGSTDIQLSNCPTPSVSCILLYIDTFLYMPPQDGINHNNPNDPRIEFTDVTFDWTAPPEGTGTIRFA